MPALPADADAAAAAGPETALAFAIEAARTHAHGAPSHSPPAELFTRSLASLIAQALAPEAGDAAFQAAVLQAAEPSVQEYARCSAHAAADRRAVRAAIDAIAHPGKTRALTEGAWRDGLARLHRLASEGAWSELGAAAQQLAAAVPAADALRAIADGPKLHRLQRLDTLAQSAPVQRFRALCERRGPAAGSDAAAAQGRASASEGERAEAQAVHAFRAIADLLNAAGVSPRLRAVRSLRPPPGFPGDASKAKDEWDVALLQDEGELASIVLLAEVKAAPAAATSDFPRLLRGLQRLAQAGAGSAHAFASDGGPVRIDGASLAALQPQGRLLPPQVIYCCSAPPEARPQALGAATRAVLLAEPASMAFAQQLGAGGSPPAAQLLPVWHALATAPRLRSALHQYDSARAVREAMLHPDDLLEAVTQAVRAHSMR